MFKERKIQELAPLVGKNPALFLSNCTVKLLPSHHKQHASVSTEHLVWSEIFIYYSTYFKIKLQRSHSYIWDCRIEPFKFTSSLKAIPKCYPKEVKHHSKAYNNNYRASHLFPSA
jgi:hypothetical protein